MLTLLILLLFITTLLATSDVGHFWIINDVHYQWNYEVGSDPETVCISGAGSAGTFGDHSCCSPSSLMLSALSFMKETHPNPDFVTFLGDIIPQRSVLKHTEFNKEILKNVLAHFTSKLEKTFPGTPLINLLGNHDIIPAHQFSPLTRYIFKDTLDLWAPYIPKDQHENYLHGGYYRMDLTERLTILVLNTNYYFTMDFETIPNHDPSHQFKWIESEMKRLIKTDRKALVFCHIPPGPFDPFAATVSNFQPQFNSKFLDSLQEGFRHSRVLSMFSGHQHSSSFRLLWDYKNDNVAAPLFISPAVVPIGDGPTEVLSWSGNNPGVRLYKYNKTSGVVLDYTQYYLNLTESNILLKDEWKVEHSGTTLFKVVDFSAKSSLKAFENLANDKGLLQKYIKSTTVGLEFDLTSKCYVRHLCAIRHVGMVDFYKCYI
ncbi:hypothetical protein GEMRC1_003167 [Eukaryota sp. GEM-RC1]